MRCIVKNCVNHEHEGKFIGNLCAPCAEFIEAGSGTYSQAYRNTQKLVQREREECAKLCDLAAFQNQEAKKLLDSTELLAKCFIQGAITQVEKLSKAIRARNNSEFKT